MDGRRARLKDVWIPVFMIAVGSSDISREVFTGATRPTSPDGGMIGLFAESGLRLLIDGYRDWKGARPQGIAVIPSTPQLAEV